MSMHDKPLGDSLFLGHSMRNSHRRPIYGHVSVCAACKLLLWIIHESKSLINTHQNAFLFPSELVPIQHHCEKTERILTTTFRLLFTLTATSPFISARHKLWLWQEGVTDQTLMEVKVNGSSLRDVWWLIYLAHGSGWRPTEGGSGFGPYIRHQLNEQKNPQDTVILILSSGPGLSSNLPNTGFPFSWWPRNNHIYCSRLLICGNCTCCIIYYN